MKGKLYYVIYLVYIFFLLLETWFSSQHQRYTHHKIYRYLRLSLRDNGNVCTKQERIPFIHFYS